MGRPKNKPDFDAEKLLDEILKNVLEEYEGLEQSQRVGGRLAYGAMKELADGLEFKPSKVKKLLITAGVRYNKEIYVNDTGREVIKLHQEGKSISEIMERTGLKRSSIFGYLPYRKTVYKASELSTDAERIRLFRSRQSRCRNFMEDIAVKSQDEAEAYLWDTLEYLQGCIFHTSGRGNREGVKFRYEIRGGEMFVNRKEKSITRASVMLAFSNTMKLQQESGCVAGPKKIGTFGASYLYPIFLRLGVCTQAQSAANRT